MRQHPYNNVIEHYKCSSTADMITTNQPWASKALSQAGGDYRRDLPIPPPHRCTQKELKDGVPHFRVNGISWCTTPKASEVEEVANKALAQAGGGKGGHRTGDDGDYRPDLPIGNIHVCTQKELNDKEVPYAIIRGTPWCMGKATTLPNASEVKEELT